MESSHTAQPHAAWNKGKLVGQKTPFKLKEIWAIRIRLQMQERLRELALFDLGIGQQAARMRSRPAPRTRRMSRRSSCSASDGLTAENPTSGAV